MSSYSREEALRIAAERRRKQKEEEIQKENEYFEKITSGTPWMLFKIVVAFCTLMFLITTIDIVADGPTKKITENDWEINRSLYMMRHQSITVGSAIFWPHLDDWLNHEDDSFEVTYSPILRTPKKLSYDLKTSEGAVRRHTELRSRSIFNWFPFLQILMLVPLFTFIFKRKQIWFTFARGTSFFLVAPASLLILIYTLI
ncbi:MAG: hypothetical protein Crog4KO_13670 [Crocinitomicaceae bacterium]